MGTIGSVQRRWDANIIFDSILVSQKLKLAGENIGSVARVSEDGTITVFPTSSGKTELAPDPEYFI